MDIKTIRQLNQINQNFYNTIAQDFSDSRSYYWQGWKELVPELEKLAQNKQTLRVLDVGCGNGRFALFLKDYLPYTSIEYTGTDNNAELLEIGNDKVNEAGIKATFHNIDIVESLLSETFLSELEDRYDLIVFFGVLHHIPSEDLRKKVIYTLSSKVATNGLFICTLWKFIDDKQLEKKDFQSLTDDLEKNDYLLSWNRGVSATRYCHYVDEVEEQELIEASQLELVQSFEADGQENKGNKYLVFTQIRSV